MRFTLFTPVYNRRDTLHRVWDSIRAQSFGDFEWICVDDGSTDGSYERLMQYRSEADFPVTVLRNESNIGKHGAWNRAVAIAQGELFVPCDSDDEFDGSALAFFDACWTDLSETERAGASGVNVLCRHAHDGTMVGTPFPQDRMWSNNLELAYFLHVTGEKWGCIRTDILKAHPFPTAKGYFPESFLWFTIARQYRVLCINEVLRTYYSDQVNRLSGRVPQVHRLGAAYEYTAWHVATNWDYISKDRRQALVEGSNLYLYGLLLGLRTREMHGRIRASPAAPLSFLLFAIGWLRYQRIRKSQPGARA
jgi:glycosyltransferase involved in cell wall biosynthesis